MLFICPAAKQVITATRDSFQDMFDDDMTLEYEPSQTAAIILVGGDEDAEKAALEVRPAVLAPCTALPCMRHRSGPGQAR